MILILLLSIVHVVAFYQLKSQAQPIPTFDTVEPTDGGHQQQQQQKLQSEIGDGTYGNFDDDYGDVAGTRTKDGSHSCIDESYNLDDENSVAPYSYSIHRNINYDVPMRNFSFDYGGILEDLTNHIVIEQRFREDGTGLGSAQWDGSFVLSELLQRLDFFQAHDALDECLLVNDNGFDNLDKEKGHDKEVVLKQRQQQQQYLSMKRCHQRRLWLPLLPQVKSKRKSQRKRAREQVRRQQQIKYQHQKEQKPLQNHETANEVSTDHQDQHIHYPWKNINTIELGSGLGLVSLVTCLLGAKSIATDGDEAVLRHARHNFVRNLNQTNSFNNWANASGKNRYNDTNNSATHSSSSSEEGKPFIHRDDWIRCSQTESEISNNDISVNAMGMITTAKLWWGDRKHTKDLLLRFYNPPLSGMNETHRNGYNNKPNDDSKSNINYGKIGNVDFVLAADVVYGYDKDSANSDTNTTTYVVGDNKNNNSAINREDTYTALIDSMIDLCENNNTNNDNYQGSKKHQTLVILAYQPRRKLSEKKFFQMLWEHFEGAPLKRDLLHPDFFLYSSMDVYVFRLKPKV